MGDLISVNTTGWSLNDWFGLVAAVVWFAVFLLAILFWKE